MSKKMGGAASEVDTDQVGFESEDIDNETPVTVHEEFEDEQDDEQDDESSDDSPVDSEDLAFSASETPSAGESFRADWSLAKFISTPAPRAYFLTITTIAGIFATCAVLCFVIEMDVSVPGRGDVAYDQELRQIRTTKPGVVETLPFKNGDSLKKDDVIAILKVGQIGLKEIDAAERELTKLKDSLLESKDRSQELNAILEPMNVEPAARGALLELTSSYKAYASARRYASQDIVTQLAPQRKRLAALKKKAAQLAKGKKKYIADFIEQTETEISQIETAIRQTTTQAQKQIQENGQAATNALQKSLSLMQAMREERQLRSPVAGRVTQMTAKLQKQLGESEVVATIAPDSAKLIANVALESRYAPRVQVGQVVKMRLDSYPYEIFGAFDGQVLEINQSRSEQGVGQLTLKASIRSPAGLNPEMAAKVQLSDGLPFSAKVVSERKTIAQFVWDKVRGLR